MYCTLSYPLLSYFNGSQTWQGIEEILGYHLTKAGMQCELDLLVGITDTKTRPNNVWQRSKLVKSGKWERIEAINKQSYPKETLWISSLMREYLPLLTPQLQRLLTNNITFFRCGQVTRACWLWYLDCFWISRSLDVDTGRNAAALIFSNSAAVGCTVFGRYALDSVSARKSFLTRLYCTS